MSFSANLQTYLQSYDPELKAVESDNEDYLFEKLTYVNHYRSITHVSVTSDRSTANLRIYVLDFFPEKQTISGSSYLFTNQLNFEHRFGSYYLRGQTLIVEQDLLIMAPHILPPLTEYLALLNENIFNITKKAAS